MPVLRLYERGLHTDTRYKLEEIIARIQKFTKCQFSDLNCVCDIRYLLMFGVILSLYSLHIRGPRRKLVCCGNTGWIQKLKIRKYYSVQLDVIYRLRSAHRICRRMLGLFVLQILAA